MPETAGEVALSRPVVPKMNECGEEKRPFYLNQSAMDQDAGFPVLKYTKEEGEEEEEGAGGVGWSCEACGQEKELPDGEHLIEKESVTSVCYSLSCGGKTRTFSKPTEIRALPTGLNPSAVPYRPTPSEPEPSAWKSHNTHSTNNNNNTPVATNPASLPTSMYSPPHFTNNQRLGWSQYDMQDRYPNGKGVPPPAVQSKHRGQGFGNGHMRIQGAAANYGSGYNRNYQQGYQHSAHHHHHHHHQHHHHQHHQQQQYGYGPNGGYGGQGQANTPPQVTQQKPPTQHLSKSSEDDEGRLFSALTQHGLGSLLKILTFHGIRSPEELGNCNQTKVRQMVKSAENQERLLAVVHHIQGMHENNGGVSGWGFGRQ